MAPHLPAPRKICRFCQKPYLPRANASKKRDWCTSYPCETAKAGEEIDRVRDWQRKKRGTATP